MTNTLAVELNRGHPYAIEPSAREIETTGSFEIAFKNEGAGRHVFLQLSDKLAASASLDEGTHFVDSGSLWSTTVTVHSSQRPIEGTLTISMGYGQESIDVKVRIVDHVPTTPILSSTLTEKSFNKSSAVENSNSMLNVVSSTKVTVILCGLSLGIVLIGLWLLPAWSLAVMIIGAILIFVIYYLWGIGDNRFLK